MAQKKAAKNSRIPQQSADSALMKTVAGFVMVAFGALMFLSVLVKLGGAVFTWIRAFTFGMGGSLAFLLPVIPIWGGVLLILSTRTKQHLRPYLLTVLALTLLATALTLFSTSASNGRAVSLMDRWAAENAGYGTAPDAFEVILSKAYRLGADRHAAGGALSILLGWPLWRVVGTVFGGILSVIGALLSVWFLFRVDLSALRGKLQAFSAQHQQNAEERRKEQNRLELQDRQQIAEERRQQPPVEWQPLEQGNGWKRKEKPAAQDAGFRAREGERFAPVQGGQFYQERIATQGVAPSVVSKLFHRPTGQTQPEEPVKAGFVRTPGKGRSRVTQQTSPLVKPQEYAADAYPPQPEQPIGDQYPPEPAPQPVKADTFPQPAPLPRQEQQSVLQEEAPQPVGRRAASRRQQAQPARPQTPWQKQVAQMQGVQESIDSLPAQEEAAPVREAPAAERRRPLQQPKPSWTDDADRPPWEDPVPVHEAVIPAAPSIVLPGTIDESKGQMLHPVKETAPLRPYTYPGMSLIAVPKPPKENLAEQDAMRAQIIETTLESFRIQSKVQQITHGPAVSRFELEIAPGVPVGRVSSLNQNIAKDLAVDSVRVQAPIPGKSLIGVEVPNPSVTPVTLREVLDTAAMRDAREKSVLAVSLGKDIAGAPVICDLEKMPHLLIAGATGSGKSVCINSIICSLLYQTSPEEVRLILIDPKVVELKVYNELPHLLLPVVNDPHKAAGALQWAVTEMMDRYDAFSERGVRNIIGYNANLEPGEKPMTRIVIIIDELADLMLACKKDVESHIQRITQLARAAGIHLIVATQRPSVNVITGVIKANIPSRIAFKVVSNIDSRTILDHQGAEGLLGKGDMLYMPTGAFAPTRVQGCFLTDGEVEAVTDYIRANNDFCYDDSIVQTLDEMQNRQNEEAPDGYSGSAAEPSGDNMLLNAVEMAVTDGQISTSLIQRRLSLGYARAGRIVDRMEELGIVSQKDGAKPRYCLIDRDRFEEMKANGDFN